VKEPSFGWGWLGVGALFVVGTLAVYHGGRHNDDARANGKGSRAHIPWRPITFRRGNKTHRGRWRVDNGILDVEFDSLVPYVDTQGGFRSIAVGTVAVAGMRQALAHHDLAEADRILGRWLKTETRS
jgi:hypothetical protein